MMLFLFHLFFFFFIRLCFIFILNDHALITEFLCLIHSLFLTLYSYSYLSLLNEESDIDIHLQIPHFEKAMYLSISYFVQDIFCNHIYNIKNHESLVLIFHHWIAVISCTIASMNIMQYYAVRLCLFEISTVFLSIKLILDKLNVSNSSVFYNMNDCCFAFCFLFFRIIYGSLLFTNFMYTSLIYLYKNDDLYLTLSVLMGSFILITMLNFTWFISICIKIKEIKL